MRFLIGMAFACCLWITMYANSSIAEDDSRNLEYGVKAGFVCNFIKFMEWPKGDFSEKESAPYRICVLGPDY